MRGTGKATPVGGEEVGVLRLVVPSLEEEDQEITWTEIPVPRDCRAPELLPQGCLPTLPRPVPGEKGLRA